MKMIDDLSAALTAAPGVLEFHDCGERRGDGETYYVYDMTVPPTQSGMVMRDAMYYNTAPDKLYARVFTMLHHAAPALLDAARALAVLTLTPGIRAHLEAHDPQALKQAITALEGLQ